MSVLYSVPKPLFPITLKGQLITLQPLDLTNDVPILYSLSNGSPIKSESISIEAYDPEDKMWELMYWPRTGNDNFMEEFYRSNYESCHFFTIFDNQTNSHIGSIGYGYINPKHLSVEIIKVWIALSAQGGGKCTEAVRIMVDHAFQMGYKVVQWRCLDLHESSKRIAEKTGFKFDVVLKESLIMKGKSFDVAYFSQRNEADINS